MDAAENSEFTASFTDTAPLPRRQRLLIRGGHGPDRVPDFCAARDQIAFDTDEITTYAQVLARLSQSGEDTVLTFDAGYQVIFPGLRAEQLTAQNFTFGSHAATLLEGTRIQTERGPIRIEDLRPDEVIWTKEHGWQALQLVIMEEVIFRDRPDLTKPILIPAGALGNGHPTANLVAAPTHRILRPYKGGRRATPAREELVPLGSLTGRNGIRPMHGKISANYYGVVLERHSIIQAEGCWVESLQVTQSCLAHQTRAARRLLEHFVGMKPTDRIALSDSRKRRLKQA